MSNVNQNANYVNKVYPKMLERYVNTLLDFGKCSDSDLIDLMVVKWMVKLHKNYPELITVPNTLLLNDVLNNIVKRCSFAKYEDLVI